MPKCSKYHGKWQILVPNCCKYKANGTRKESKRQIQNSSQKNTKNYSEPNNKPQPIWECFMPPIYRDLGDCLFIPTLMETSSINLKKLYSQKTVWIQRRWKLFSYFFPHLSNSYAKWENNRYKSSNYIPYCAHTWAGEPLEYTGIITMEYTL